MLHKNRYVYKNRHGEVYELRKLGDRDSTYQLTGNLKHFRVGGLVGQKDVDMENLGFIDPSGGPFLSVGDEIEGKRIKRIYQEMQPVFLFEVEE